MKKLFIGIIVLSIAFIAVMRVTMYGFESSRFNAEVELQIAETENVLRECDHFLNRDETLILLDTRDLEKELDYWTNAKAEVENIYNQTMSYAVTICITTSIIGIIYFVKDYKVLSKHEEV